MSARNQFRLFYLAYIYVLGIYHSVFWNFTPRTYISLCVAYVYLLFHLLQPKYCLIWMTVFDLFDSRSVSHREQKLGSANDGVFQLLIYI